MEEAQDALYQMQLPSWHFGADFFVGQSFIQCFLRGGADARRPITFAVIVGLSFVVAELYDVVGVDLDGGDTTTTQGLAADPPSG